MASLPPVLPAPEIVYLTDKRVVALPFDPALLDRLIAEYRITYLLTSSEFLTRHAKPLADHHYLGALTARFLVEHPNRYHLVRSVQENYGAFYPPITSTTCSRSFPRLSGPNRSARKRKSTGRNRMRIPGAEPSSMRPPQQHSACIGGACFSLPAFDFVHTFYARLEQDTFVHF